MTVPVISGSMTCTLPIGISLPWMVAWVSTRPNHDQASALAANSMISPEKMRAPGEAGVSRISIAAAWKARSSRLRVGRLFSASRATPSLIACQ
ncbi:hypothetical protein [Mesorhizobium sp.]|uniref:hypothetical protein n=1 Tax=Mesorhizobium sp. TaxID=1871066 RepID=UPI000FE7AA3A|nr:hypothetical protein [Mesorhizobium sp.]RWP52576.1 MAG: hypothetical protein EOR07_34785 [Mesorhizobium sp.]